MSAAQVIEMLEVLKRETGETIRRISEWAGGDEEAMTWYRTQPLPAFGGQTSEMLVDSGQSAALRHYLECLAIGGFA